MARLWPLYFSFFVISLSVSLNVEGIGINWGTKTSHSLPPETVVQMLKDNGINKVKFFDVDSSILNALAGSGFDVTIGLPNERLAEMGDYNKAKEWVKQNVTAFEPTSMDGVNITMVSIGNEPFLVDYKSMFINATLPALLNIQKALDEAGIGHIKATVPFNGDVYYSPYDHPVPSAGLFRPEIKDVVVEIVKALDKSKAPIMVNINPFLALYEGQGSFPFEYAFFDGVKTPIIDGKAEYDNVYDANLDTLASALNANGFGKMPIIVGEVGWPSDGDINANSKLAARFNNGLMKKLAEGKGTALRPGNTEVYLFELFDENRKSILPGDFERHWGIFNYDGQPKYELDLSGGNKKFIGGAKAVKYLENKWCIVKQNVKDKKALDEAITFACDRTDCTALETGGSCSNLDDHGKASYALNNYFQTMNQAKGSCDSGGLAEVTNKNISQGSCNFYIQFADLPSPTAAPPTAASPIVAPPTAALPTVASSTAASPTVAPPTAASSTVASPTAASPTVAPPTAASPTVAPPTAAPRSSPSAHSEAPDSESSSPAPSSSPSDHSEDAPDSESSSPAPSSSPSDHSEDTLDSESSSPARPLQMAGAFFAIILASIVLT